MSQINNLNFKETITITFGNQAENHKGMQIIGQEMKEGLNYEDLLKVMTIFEGKGYKCELIKLESYINEKVDPASILIIRNGSKEFLGGKNADDLFEEQKKLEYDKKAIMYGKVVNKHARHNLCMDETAQEPDYDNKKGRIVAFKDIPLTNQIRTLLPDYINDSAKNLIENLLIHHKLINEDRFNE